MDTIFTNSGNSKISDPHRLIPNLSDNVNLKGSVTNILHYQILVSNRHEKYRNVI